MGRAPGHSRLTLVDHLPATFGPDELSDAFVAWVESRGLELYTAQEEALIEVVSGSNVIVSTPTGSGKSLVAAGAHEAPSHRRHGAHSQRVGWDTADRPRRSGVVGHRAEQDPAGDVVATIEGRLLFPGFGARHEISGSADSEKEQPDGKDGRKSWNV